MAGTSRHSTFDPIAFSRQKGAVKGAVKEYEENSERREKLEREGKGTERGAPPSTRSAQMLSVDGEGASPGPE